MRNKNWLASAKLMLVGLMTVSVVSACSSKDGQTSASASPSTSASATPQLPPVELTWYYPIQAAQPDQTKIEEAANKIIKEKINATVKFRPIAQGDYNTKMNTIVGAAEDFDLAFTSNWLWNFRPVAEKGGFYEITNEMVAKYLPNTKKNISDAFWKSALVNDKVNVIPTILPSANSLGFKVQKRFIDKYKFDVKTVKKFEDIEPLLKQIKDNDAKDGIIPFGNFGSSYYTYCPDCKPYTTIAANHRVLEDGTYKVIPEIETEITNKWWALSRSWYEKGYYHKDNATVKPADFLNKGLVAVDVHTSIAYGNEAQDTATQGQEIVYIPITTPVASPTTTAAFGISRTSKNPERSLMLIELLNTDKALLNLLIYGIEGVHYDKLQGDFIKPKPNTAYNAKPVSYAFGYSFNRYLIEGEPADYHTKNLEYNKNMAPEGKYADFNFDKKNIATEEASMNAVMTEYRKAINSGNLDLTKTLPELKEKMKKAGQDKYIAELQKQLDEWLVKKGIQKK
ncbi:ABC transporter substrate-binding protein [Paenibacillus koleovorans]|uniref:ABC transporter substrate-binding protein n=1 Tax=Paenibacillus koleovorans TaxID=121608 RepID=UPI0013E3C42C|nr:ABC transporter substrate-binding protein [Paenibacillus koleovorans]